MPAFLVALMVVLLLVLGLTVVLLMTRLLRREGDAVERRRDARSGAAPTPSNEEH